MTLRSKSLGAFAEDCHSGSRHRQGNSAWLLYAGHLTLHHPKLRNRGIKPAACTFDTDVFVADARKWRIANVTDQLIAWVNMSTRYCSVKITLGRLTELAGYFSLELLRHWLH